MKKIILLNLCMYLFIGITSAQVRLPALFSDKMVLQQNSKVAI